LDVETYKETAWTDLLRSIHGIVSSARPNLDNALAFPKVECSDDAIGTGEEAPHRSVEHKGVGKRARSGLQAATKPIPPRLDQ
jgi:hypothetical protein